MKIVERKIFNNGYGCSCCREDWEETNFINESDMIPFETLLTDTVKKLERNIGYSGVVGIIYEKNNKTLYGVNSEIGRALSELSAVFGGGDDGDYLYEMPIKGYADISGKEYSPEEIIKAYKEYIQE